MGRSGVVTALLFVAGLAAVVVVGAHAAASPLSLTFDGRHVASPAGFQGQPFMHEGSFTATGSFCPSGVGADLKHSPAGESADRVYTCADGSGSITVHLTSLNAEHITNGRGGWRIVAGTGRYETLRGAGDWASATWAGDPADLGTVTYRTTATGLVDFDADAPTVAITRATAKRLKKPAGAYDLQIAIGARDAVQDSVSWELSIGTPARHFATRTGRSTTGTASVKVRIKPPKSVRTVRVELTGTDAVGNARTVARSVRLR